MGVVNDVTGRGRHTSTSAVALRLPEVEIEVGAGSGAAAEGGAGGAEADVSEASVSSGAAEVLAGGWVIDTPGVRSFGLAHVAPETVIAAFPDLAAITAECPRGCTHMADAPDCRLDEVETDPARVDSLRRLLTALSSDD